MSKELDLQSVYEEIRNKCVERYRPLKDGKVADIFPRIVVFCEKILQRFYAENVEKKSFLLLKKSEKRQNKSLSKCIRRCYFDLYDDKSENYFSRHKVVFGNVNYQENPYMDLQEMARRFSATKSFPICDSIFFLKEILFWVQNGSDANEVASKVRELVGQFDDENL